MDEIVLWDKEPLEDIFNNFMRERKITFPDKYYDLLEEYSYKLFNTSSQDAITKQNLIKLCEYVNLYITNTPDYRTVKPLSRVEIDMPIEGEDKLINKNGQTYIYDYKKYEGSPQKALTTSLNIAEDLYENLLIIGDTKENQKLRELLRDLTNNPEKYTRKKNKKYGDHQVTKTYIKNFLNGLKLPYKTDTINFFVDKLEKLKKL